MQKEEEERGASVGGQWAQGGVTWVISQFAGRQGVWVHNKKAIFELRKYAFVNVTTVDQVSFYPISSVNY